MRALVILLICFSCLYSLGDAKAATDELSASCSGIESERQGIVSRSGALLARKDKVDEMPPYSPNAQSQYQSQYQAQYQPQTQYQMPPNASNAASQYRQEQPMQGSSPNFAEFYSRQPPPEIMPSTGVLVSTTSDIPGYRVVAYKGIVRGDVVIEPTIFQSFRASMKAIVGGKIGAYTQMCQRARVGAFEDMLVQARNLGANAVIGMKYDSSTFSTSADNDVGTEVFCYGTAVMIEPLR